jgi:hypothetical protein
MSSNVRREALRLLEGGAQTSRRAQLTPAQYRACRQLAIAALGLDVRTLTAQLRGRRLRKIPLLRIVPPADLAA